MRRSTILDNSSNLQIHGDVNVYSSGTSVQDVHNIVQVNQQAQATKAKSRAIKQGFKILSKNTAPSARYGYGHSFTGPQCHPGTRVAVQEHIFKWFDDEDGQIAMWMHGPVGIGKSAIAQTVAHLAAEREQLSSAFFFFRSDETRNTAKHLVATLAYEMTQQMPHTRDHVCQTVASNPLIFSSPLEHQIKFTLLGPASSTSESSPQRRLIVTDGLDECLDISMHQVIIRSFILTLNSMAKDTIPHKILIASRPESQIASAFSAADISPYVKRLALDSWDTKEDIQSFLRAKLDDIHHTHPLKHHLPDMWPDDYSFRRLLYRSVGSFAYASVAISHLSSHNNNPEHALRDLLSIQSTQVAAAFADLDALYRHILSSLDPTQLLLLRKFLCLYVYDSPSSITGRSYAAVLMENCSIVELVLIRVSSLIGIYGSFASSSHFYFHHTSFQEFLCNETRSGDLYVYSSNIVSTVVDLLSNLWLHPISDQKDYEWFSKLIPVPNFGHSRPKIDMTYQILNTLVKTKLPISFLYPTIAIGTPLAQRIIDPTSYTSLCMGGEFPVIFRHVSQFCKALHRALLWKDDDSCWDLTDEGLFYQAFNVIVCGWLRLHLDILFQGTPTVKDIIDFLLGNQSQWSNSVGESYSFQIFHHLVLAEEELLLSSSSCIFSVFPDIDHADIYHGIIDRYIALQYSQRHSDTRIFAYSGKHNLTLTHLYIRVLHCNNPTIPSVCQRLEAIISAEQNALGLDIGSPFKLTSKDYLLRFFSGFRCCIDRNGKLAIASLWSNTNYEGYKDEGDEDDEDNNSEGDEDDDNNSEGDEDEDDDNNIKVLDLLGAWTLQDYARTEKSPILEIAEITSLYIHRAHREHDFAYFSADVETICKNQRKS